MAYSRQKERIILANKITKNQQKLVRKRESPQDLRELVIELQTLKGITGQYLNLKIQQYNKQFKALINSKVIKNYILPKTAERIKILYK